MASLIFSTIGASMFGSIGGAIGTLLGSQIDNYAISRLSGTIRESSKLGSLKVQTSEDGAAMPIIYGKMRISGQVIWASKFKEHTSTRRVGGKTGQKVSTNSYSISFAIGICDGPISGIGRVFANGDEIDINNYEYRLYLGAANQDKDPLIEAIEGIINTPKYNDIAYIVFEDFLLDDYGDRIPQLSFEVFAPPKNAEGKSLEELINGVCLIPGAGEFAYATTPMTHLITRGKEESININQSGQKADIKVALDNLERDLPNANNISFVCAWFGDDLRADYCKIMPRVDLRYKPTKPRTWQSAGLNRSNAPLISSYNNKSAYGGSPDDNSIIEALIEMNGRGLKVTFNPFIMMDIPANNNLPNLNGVVPQPAYPWRGRIGIDSASDKTTNAQNKINTFYGNVNASHFVFANNNFSYNGPSEYSYSRFILHCAALCKIAGGVDSFLIGSEMVELTKVRAPDNSFPFVDKLIALAAEVKKILPNAKIGYGADWTEYGARYFTLGNDTRFCLDKLWANSNVDFIGIDFYAPLSNRRPEDDRCSIEDFKANIESGEAYDFYFASDADRQNNVKTQIKDNYNEPWVYRQKDIRNFWQNTHYERFNGVRAQSPTLWIAKSKPIRIMELGYPAINRGANRPSVFPDAKSSENGIPPFSDGTRDDMEQRNALFAFFDYWANNNLASNLYNGQMIERIHVWAWDARPYPAFPSLTHIWADGDNMAKGHWIMGRMGSGNNIAHILYDIAKMAGFENIDCSQISGIIDGYIIESPKDAKSAIEPLMQCFGIDFKIDNNSIVFFFTNSDDYDFEIDENLLLLNDNGESLVFENSPNEDVSKFIFSCYDKDNDYEVVSQIAFSGSLGKVSQYNAPIVAQRDLRDKIAKRLLALSNQSINIKLPPEYSMIAQIGDIIKLFGNFYKITSLDGAFCKDASILLINSNSIVSDTAAIDSVNNTLSVYSTPYPIIIDAPYPFTKSANPSALFFTAQEPWFGPININFNNGKIGTIEKSAKTGFIINDLPASNISQRLNISVQIKLDIGSLYNQQYYLAFFDDSGVIDIISFENAVLVDEDIYQINGIVRGFNGIANAPTILANTSFIVLDDAGIEIDIDRQFINLEMPWQFTTDGYSTDSGEEIDYTFNNDAKKCFSPCHVKVNKDANGANIRFIRRALGNGDSLEAVEVPNQINEKYDLKIFDDNNILKRQSQISTNYFSYTNLMQQADFGGTQAYLNLEIAQINDDGIIGNIIKQKLYIQ